MKNQGLSNSGKNLTFQKMRIKKKEEISWEKNIEKRRKFIIFFRFSFYFALFIIIHFVIVNFCFFVLTV